MSGSTIFKSTEKRDIIRTWNERFRERLTVPVEDAKVKTSFGEAHALVTGPEDAPPLVVLHGAMASSAHVLPELGPLAKTHRVYAIDVVGQSVASEDRRLELGDDSYGRWFVEVVDGLGLDTFDLFGVSWGGFVSMRGAAIASARVRSLVLMCPAGVVGASAWAGMRDVGWPMMLYKMFPSDARFERVMRALFTTLDPDWTAYFKDAFDAYKMDMRVPPLLGPSDVGTGFPVLVFACAEDGSFPGARLVARAKEIFPHAETELIPDAKHCPPLTDAFRNQMAARVERFYASKARSNAA